MDMWTITIIGIGTVFVALIVLALMLELFRIIFVPKVEATPILAPVPVSQAQVQATSTGIEGGIVAAIVAAIAAASGTTASEFRIASIEPVGFNTPAWGHIDRLARGPRGV